MAKERGVQAVALNIHPASGVLSHEDCFGDLKAALGFNLKEVEAISLQEIMRNEETKRLFAKFCLEPLGADVMWVDWQQGESWALLYDPAGGERGGARSEDGGAGGKNDLVVPASATTGTVAAELNKEEPPAPPSSGRAPACYGRVERIEPR